MILCSRYTLRIHFVFQFVNESLDAMSDNQQQQSVTVSEVKVEVTETHTQGKRPARVNQSV